MPHILFVDDEKNILRSIRRNLFQAGFEILTASSGAEGLNVLKEHPVDIVVSDVKMPEMDGIEFLTHVKESHPAVSRILLSGYVERNEVFSEHYADDCRDGAV